MKQCYATFPFLFSALTLTAQGPEVTSWVLNQGETGSYYVQGNSTPQTMTTLADVQLVQYDATDAYISATGIPAYPTGPFLDGNPSLAADNGYIFRIPRVPQVAGTSLEAPLGHIGVLINGVPIFNAEDAMSYNNAGVWLRNAVYWENDGMDCSKGHPAPSQGPNGVTQGRYHHHQNPIPFSTANVVLSAICNLYPADGLYSPDANVHSPLIGFAFDGYPIYGCYGYDDPNDPNSGIRRIESSWQLRGITQRHELADGTVLNSSAYGPNVNAQYPLGCFIQDYEYVPGAGDLDQHNGRFCKTPEYPNGTYAYFGTVDADLNSAYPYFIGPTYYGEVVTDNFPTPGPGNPSTNVTVPGGTTQWTGNTGIAVQGDGIRLHVAPNPTAGRLRVELPPATDALRLVGFQGALLRTWRPHGTVEWIDLGELAPGCYVLETKGERGRSAVQVMKL
ncbi:MAG: YHYH protein [Flavobacteriales bacterium]|nr:YHYH protein [Flavobacteriales bacterium]MCB9166828.1 YHYH protein [Flavobacteriales bacterium]